MARGAKEQVPDLVRDRTADQASRVHARPARNGPDAIEVNRGEGPPPLLEIDERITERPGHRRLRSGDDSHHDLVRTERLGTADPAVAPRKLHARVPQDRARLVACDWHLKGCQSGVVVGPNDEPLHRGAGARRRHGRSGNNTKDTKGTQETKRETGMIGHDPANMRDRARRLNDAEVTKGEM